MVIFDGPIVKEQIKNVLFSRPPFFFGGGGYLQLSELLVAELWTTLLSGQPLPDYY